MTKQMMNPEIMEYMVWVIEIVAEDLCSGDKTVAYNALKNSGLWDIYVEHYETTHTLGKEYLVNEIREHFTKNGVSLPC